MATIHFHFATTATPEQFVDALTDFGPGRSEVFGNSADDYLKVYDIGSDHADVKEGSGGAGNASTTTGRTRTTSS